MNQCQDGNVIQNQYYSNNGIESNNYETPISKQVTCIEGISDYNQPQEPQMQFLCNQSKFENGRQFYILKILFIFIQMNHLIIPCMQQIQYQIFKVTIIAYLQFQL